MGNASNGDILSTTIGGLDGADFTSHNTVNNSQSIIIGPDVKIRGPIAAVQIRDARLAPLRLPISAWLRAMPWQATASMVVAAAVALYMYTPPHPDKAQQAHPQTTFLVRLRRVSFGDVLDWLSQRFMPIVCGVAAGLGFYLLWGQLLGASVVVTHKTLNTSTTVE